MASSRVSAAWLVVALATLRLVALAPARRGTTGGDPRTGRLARRPRAHRPMGTQH